MYRFRNFRLEGNFLHTESHVIQKISPSEEESLMDLLSKKGL